MRAVFACLGTMMFMTACGSPGDVYKQAIQNSIDQRNEQCYEMPSPQDCVGNATVTRVYDIHPETDFPTVIPAHSVYPKINYSFTDAVVVQFDYRLTTGETDTGAVSIGKENGRWVVYQQTTDHYQVFPSSMPEQPGLGQTFDRVSP